MRNIILTTILLMMVSVLPAMGKGALTFESTQADFGNVKAKGGEVSMTYRFTNTGDEPVSIVTVTNGGCGCTKPTFSPKPYRPGESGEIVIHFNPATFRGEVNREVKVQTSAQKKRLKLRFQGIVIP